MTNTVSKYFRANPSFTRPAPSGYSPLDILLGGINNIKSPPYNAVGDGAEDDSTPIEDALASSAESLFIPQGTYLTDIADGTISKRIYGEGQIKTGSNKRGRYLSYVTAAPASLGNHNSVLTAFNGDLSKCQFAVEHRVTGAATLGQPTSGYLYTPEAYPFYGNLYNSSGHNQSTSLNDGRTAVSFFRIKLTNVGQGDGVIYNGATFVSGAKSGATSFLANPAGGLFNGDVTAGSNGVYLNPFEVYNDDAGYDVAGAGAVVNSGRTNATGALDVFWAGFLSQSKGTAQIDAHFHATGKSRIGLNLVGTIFDASKIGIALEADTRIYLNCSNALSTKFPDGVTTTTDYIDYSSSLGGVRIVTNNVAQLQVKDDSVTTISRIYCPSIQAGTIIGGSGTTSTITYKTTTGVGASGADHIFVVGNNGATEAFRILNAGYSVITRTADGSINTTLYVNNGGTSTNTGCRIALQTGAVSASTSVALDAIRSNNPGAGGSYFSLKTYDGSTQNECFRGTEKGGISFPGTITTGGTTGAQTINKTLGRVNLAVAATSIVVTNSLCTTSSIVFAQAQTNDTTAKVKNVVPGSGSFTINMEAAVTAETAVAFELINLF